MQAHDATVSKVSWAHPEFGSIIASSSFDRTVKIWEQTSSFSSTDSELIHVNENGDLPGQSSSPASTSRWVERAVLLEARDVEIDR